LTPSPFFVAFNASYKNVHVVYNVTIDISVTPLYEKNIEAFTFTFVEVVVVLLLII
jgi:hypothetical protein